LTGVIDLAPGLWVIERPQRFWGVEVGTRTTVVRLPGGGLFVHSPGALDAALRAEIEVLGRPTVIVAPSRFHHLYVPAWSAAWPDAERWACPGLLTKRADVAWTGGLGDAPEAAWAGALEQVHFAARTLEDEVVFFHGASRTLICADAVFNLGSHPSWFTRLAAFGLANRGPGTTWVERFQISDRAAARRQLDRMLAWNAERLVLAHGGLVEHGGGEVLRAAYAWV
jgi:hypothetical protein